MVSVEDLLGGTEEFGRPLKKAGGAELLRIKTNEARNRLLFVFTIPGTDGSYEMLVAFDGIEAGKFRTEVKTNRGTFKIKKITRQNKVRVRCDCEDYRFTWYRVNKKEQAHIGKPFTFPTPTGTGKPRNPHGINGICKHLIGAFDLLKGAGYMR